MRNIFLIVVSVFLLQSCSNIRLSNSLVRDDVYYDLPQNNYYNITQYDQIYYNRLRLGVYPSWNWQPNRFWDWNDPFCYNRWFTSNWTLYRYNCWWEYNYWGYSNYWGYNWWRSYRQYQNYWYQYPNIYGNRTYYGQRPYLNSRLNNNFRSYEINRNLLNIHRQIARESSRLDYRFQSTRPSPSTRPQQQYTRPPITTRPTSPRQIYSVPRSNPTPPTRTAPRTTVPIRTQPKPLLQPTRTSPRISK